MIKRRKIVPEAEDRHRDRWLLSYADLVTLLLALFIVLYAASDRERAQQIAASFNAQNVGGAGILPGNTAPEEDARQDSEKALKAIPLLMQKTQIQQTSRGLIVSMSEAGFFAPGEAAISAEASTVIKALADKLNEAGTPVRVEGHTDSTPISNSRYSSNWELSTARSASVLQKLIEFGFTPEKLSAAGYGGFQPVADNASAEGRAQNRRVDIVILNR